LATAQHGEKVSHLNLNQEIPQVVFEHLNVVV